MKLPSELTDGLVPFPAELVQKYRDEGLWGELTIADELHRTATEHPSRNALVTPELALTYAELDRDTDLVAEGLYGLGLRTGDRALLQVTNRAWTVIAWYGLLKAGVIPIATLPQHRQHEIFEIGAQAEATAHLIEPGFPGGDLVGLAADAAKELSTLKYLLTIGTDDVPDGAVALEPFVEDQSEGRMANARDLVAGIQAEIDSDDLAVLQLSGGTTSIPKLIPRLHAEYWFNSRQYAAAVDIEPGDVVAHLLPMVHNAGVVCALHAAHAVGASVATCMYDADAIKALAAQGQPTHVILAPPLLKLILGDPEMVQVFRGLKRLVWVLGKLPDALWEAFESDTCKVVQLFGQGEGLCMVTPADAPESVRRRCIGKPISELDEVRVLEPGSDDEAPLGDQGELCCRGPYTLRGYYRAPERNKEAFTSDGFYRSGDIVVAVDEAGSRWYMIEDRIKDLISRGGEKINAVEVEQLLIRHPAITEAAVVAMPDERLGERACAFVVADDEQADLTVDAVARFLDGEGVAKFKWPERIEPVDTLPYTNVDKINKVQLRARIAEQLENERAGLRSAT